MATELEILISFDDLTEVLSAYVAGTRTAHFGPAPSDGHLMLERDHDGNVVGVELLTSSLSGLPFWKRHPDRGVVPTELVAEIDRWLARHWEERVPA
jgi:hypothetical protein